MEFCSPDILWNTSWLLTVGTKSSPDVGTSALLLLFTSPGTGVSGSSTGRLLHGPSCQEFPVMGTQPAHGKCKYNWSESAHFHIGSLAFISPFPLIAQHSWIGSATYYYLCLKWGNTQVTLAASAPSKQRLENQPGWQALRPIARICFIIMFFPKLLHYAFFCI